MDPRVISVPSHRTVSLSSRDKGEKGDGKGEAPPPKCQRLQSCRPRHCGLKRPEEDYTLDLGELGRGSDREQRGLWEVRVRGGQNAISRGRQTPPTTGRLGTSPPPTASRSRFLSIACSGSEQTFRPLPQPGHWKTDGQMHSPLPALPAGKPRASHWRNSQLESRATDTNPSETPPGKQLADLSQPRPQPTVPKLHTRTHRASRTSLPAPCSPARTDEGNVTRHLTKPLTGTKTQRGTEKDAATGERLK